MTNFYFISQSICSSTLCLMGLTGEKSVDAKLNAASGILRAQVAAAVLEMFAIEFRGFFDFDEK